MIGLPQRAERRGEAAERPARFARAAAAALLLLASPRALAVGLERVGEIVASGGGTALLAPAALWYDGVRDALAVACPNLHRVLVIDRQGAVQKELGKKGEVQFPRAVAGTRDGTVYVASAESESLVVFEGGGAATGDTARSVSLSAHRASRPVRPTALFADEGGKLYVADRANRQVLVLGPDGKLERALRDVGEPADVWADGAGNVYVAEPVFGGVRVYDRRGRLARTLGTSPTRFSEPIRPAAVAVDRSGRVWVLEEGNRGIKALDPFGNLLFDMRGDGLFAPVDLAIDPRDTLYVLEEGANRIAVFRISGP